LELKNIAKTRVVFQLVVVVLALARLFQKIMLIMF
jgi:hypothetical protein